MATTGVTLWQVVLISLSTAGLAGGLTYASTRAEIVRIREGLGDVRVEIQNELVSLREQEIRTQHYGHTHVRLENGLHGCAPLGRANSAASTTLVRKSGAKTCSAALELAPIDGGTCPTDVDIHVSGQRIPMRGIAMLASGGLLLSTEFPCEHVEEIDVLGVSPPS